MEYDCNGMDVMDAQGPQNMVLKNTIEMIQLSRGIASEVVKKV